MTKLLKKLFWLIPLAVMVYGIYKPLPKGLSYRGKIHNDSAIRFHYNLRYDTEQQSHWETPLYDKVCSMIEEAEEFIVCDLFLFNDYYKEKVKFPPLADQLTEELIRKKQDKPQMRILFITDPVNTVYGFHESPHIERLKEHGVEVVITKLELLRDSNPLFSGFWRSYIRWLGVRGQGWLPHPVSSVHPQLTLRAYLYMFNIKANHRKVILTEKEGLITSANPHDASAYHANIGYSFRGRMIQDILESEKAVVDYCGVHELPVWKPGSSSPVKERESSVQVLTEGQIWKDTLKIIEDAQPGDELLIATLYLSERKMIRQLVNAARRGVKIKIIFDQNMEAFGQSKIGLPNVPVAEELKNRTADKIKIRWYETKGEQFHPKMLILKRGEQAIIIAGSANFTRRNLKNLNLESNVKIQGNVSNEAIKDSIAFFNRLWNNEDGLHTAAYETYKSSSRFLKFIYRIQKLLKLSTY
ncbi:phospholipase D family protein [Thalassobacillus sp. C254]|uniref:phospholipase D family protein n=1 Tax=Thalassobacillus sp. C254 TaxID=1225341 RepID=UPI0006D1F32D|nr:phospholipase D family protein [Thalassobacillus sp. C254]